MTSLFATGSANDGDIYLFDPLKLTQLSNWARLDGSLRERNLLLRPLKLTDVENGYNELSSSNCNPANEVTRIEFERRFKLWKADEDHAVVVLEEITTRKIIGASTLSLELKFIHQCSIRGRVENVVVLDIYKDKELSEILVETLVSLAKGPYKCYKLTLDCTDDLKEFYVKSGFAYGSNMLKIDFDVINSNISSFSTGGDNCLLFDQQIFTHLNEWSEIERALKEKNLLARPLKLSDYESGYIELLSQLTVVGNVTKAEFEKRFIQMQAKNQIEGRYAVVIIEDTITGEMVGASTLFINRPSITLNKLRGRLEDVAVLDKYRGKNIGFLVVKIIVGLAKEAFKCHKLSLDCTDDLKKFYGKNGFDYGMNMLQIKFDN